MVVVVGAGFIGRAVACSTGARLVPRRDFRPEHLAGAEGVVVASGRASVARDEPVASTLRSELDHLRRVLDTAEAEGVGRVVVLGSADVAGFAPVIRGDTPQAPLTRYGEVKSALEDECCLRASAWPALTSLRIAAVHGPGKPRTEALVRLARRAALPVPNGGGHSIGFVILGDVVRAVRWLLTHPASSVVAVGGGRTPLRDLLRELAIAQETQLRQVPVPVPLTLARICLRPSIPDLLGWGLRLAVPRTVVMEVPVDPTPLPEAARHLCALQ